MTTIRTLAVHLASAGTALALSLVLFGATVSTHAPAGLGATTDKEISA